MCGDSTGGTSLRRGKPPVFDYQGFLIWLRDKGFRTASVELPRHLYEAYGFQRLIPYLDFLEKASVPIRRRTLEELNRLIQFDDRLRVLLFRWIGVVEMQVRAQYRQALFDMGGAYCLYDETRFRNVREHASNMRAIEAEVKRQARNNAGARRALSEQDGRIPVWTAIDAVTFGTLRRMYNNTSIAAVTTRVSASFGVNKRCFRSWLRTLVLVRNCCAHFNPYAVRAQIPAVPKPVVDAGGDNASPLYVLVVLDRLLKGRAQVGAEFEQEEWRSFRSDADRLVGAFVWEYSDLAGTLQVPYDFVDRFAGPRLPVVHFDRGICRESLWTECLAA